MLILSRHATEGLVLEGKDGLEIHIVILGVHGGKVSVGINAPSDIAIRRDELPEGYYRTRQRPAMSV